MQLRHGGKSPGSGCCCRAWPIAKLPLRFKGIRDALAARGYTEGSNLVLESRSIQGRPENASSSAAELARLKLDLVIGSTTPVVAALQTAMPTTPIVMLWVSDPVGAGFARNLARPGGRITGISDQQEDLLGKVLELAGTLAPARKIGVLLSDTNPFHQQNLTVLRAYAAASRITATPFAANDEKQIDAAFLRAAAEGMKMMVIFGGPPFNSMRPTVAAAGLRRRIGTATMQRDYVESGALFSYGPLPGSLYRPIADYVDRILNGEAPGDLAILQPQELELTINGTTATRLGIAIPPALRLSAEVIE